MIQCLMHNRYEVRHAAAYGLAQMAAQAPQVYAQVIGAAVEHLYGMVAAPGSREAPNTEATDNAIEALLRIAQVPEMPITESELDSG